MRRIDNIASGTRIEYCMAVHAEQNAILNLVGMYSARYFDLSQMNCYVTHKPCNVCMKMLTGFKEVIYGIDYGVESHIDSKITKLVNLRKGVTI